jgi:hypothetical protein
MARRDFTAPLRNTTHNYSDFHMRESWERSHLGCHAWMVLAGETILLANCPEPPSRDDQSSRSPYQAW